MQTQLNQQDKQTFDNLNQTSYLLRLQLNRLNFDVHQITVAGDTIWHVFYNDIIVGTITYRTTEDNYTYCNIRLYQYIKQKFDDEIDDFIMSKYFEFDSDGNRVRFLFDKFDEYFNKIADVLPKTEVVDVNSKEVSVADSLLRLKEYCDEFDEQFSKNVLARDIRVLLKEYDKLVEHREELTSKLMDLL